VPGSRLNHGLKSDRLVSAPPLFRLVLASSLADGVRAASMTTGRSTPAT
jgi:hypothetical protein